MTATEVAACSECGVDESSMTVQDAVVTLRSLPRRWRAVLATLDEDDIDVLSRRPPDGSPSALEHEAAARAAIGGDPERLATEAERRDADEWKDPALLSTLRGAAHAGVHHLKLAERSLRAVRGAGR
ncbi:MAG TPA: hypothetical protein VEA78_04150 [Acidimicrobiales bacterium]|nr:hypothetical protein [Acidimicrobiales bacterium]